MTTVIADREAQRQIVEKAIAKMRVFGLSYPADKLEELLNMVLEHLTRPEKE